MLSAYELYLRAQTYKSVQKSVDGIRMANVLALFLYDDRGIRMAKRVVWALFTRSTYSVQVTSQHRRAPGLIFFSFTGKRRSDYNFIIDKIGTVGAEHFDRVDVEDAASLTQWPRTLRHLSQGHRAARAYPGGWVRRAVLALCAARAFSESRRLRQFVADRATLVTFCDAAPWDNMCVQLASPRTRTATVQHGQYRVLDSTNMSADAEAILNFISDRMLIWGPATSKEFQKAGISPDRLHAVGWIRDWPKAPIRPTEPLGIFGVVLNGENGAQSNAALLETAEQLAAELGLKYVVRLHPSYASKAMGHADLKHSLCDGVFSPSEYMEATDFSLCHMSGATIELLHYGWPVFIWDDGALADVFKVPGMTYDEYGKLATAVETLLNHAPSDHAAKAEWFSIEPGFLDQRLREGMFNWGKND